MSSKSTPNAATRAAEETEAKKKASADREPTTEEQEIASRMDLDSDVAGHEEEMLERGSAQKGEGRLP